MAAAGRRERLGQRTANLSRQALALLRSGHVVSARQEQSVADAEPQIVPFAVAGGLRSERPGTQFRPGQVDQQPRCAARLVLG